MSTVQIPAIQLTPQLATIQSRSSLIRSVKNSLTESFGQDLPGLRGNIELVQEVLICIESMSNGMKTDAQKTDLFFEVYIQVFGQMAEGSIERIMLGQIIEHLRGTGAIYRRTRMGNFVRAILRMFRA